MQERFTTIKTDHLLLSYNQVLHHSFTINVQFTFTLLGWLLLGFHTGDAEINEKGAAPTEEVAEQEIENVLLTGYIVPKFLQFYIFTIKNVLALLRLVYCEMFRTK